jgi:solute carrier family 35 protein E3
VTLAINYFYGVSTTPKVKLSLAILLAGVGVATVTDVQLRPVGLVFGGAAVITTAMFQIWQGTKQKDYGLSGTQLQSGIAPWQTFQSLAVASATEFVCLGSAPCVTVRAPSACGTAAAVPAPRRVATRPRPRRPRAPFAAARGVAARSAPSAPSANLRKPPHPPHPLQALDYFEAAAASEPTHVHTMLLVLGTCFLALLVNFCSFGLIGRTSPITFQVVGHAKTCLVLVGGYVLFPAKAQDTQQFYNNITGVAV